MTDGSIEEMHNPADMPDPVKIDYIEERIKATILVPDEFLGSVLSLYRSRHSGRTDLCRQPCHARLQTAAERSRLRLLRPSEELFEGLCEL